MDGAGGSSATPIWVWVGWSTTVAFLLPSSSLTPDFHPSVRLASHWWQALRDSGVESDLSRVEKFVESFKDVGLDIADEAQKEIRETKPRNPLGLRAIEGGRNSV